MRNSWLSVELGEIVDFVGGGTPSKKVIEYWNGDIPWASIKDIKGDILTATSDSITELGLNNSAANLAYPNEIILGTRINPGRPIISSIKTAINQDLKVVKPKITIGTHFLFWAFKNAERQILKVSSGTTVLGINLNNLRLIKIPLPPLPEQRAIVSKIEQLFSELDKGIADLKTSQEQLKIYRQAVLKKAFEGEFTKEWRELQTNLPTADELLEQIKEEREAHYENQIDEWKGNFNIWEDGGKDGKKPTKPKKVKEILELSEVEQNRLPKLTEEWQWDKIGNSFLSLDQGWSPRCENEPSNVNEWGVIKTTAIQANFFDESHNKRLPSHLFPKIQHELKDGDILITRAGPRVRVGVCCLIKKVREKLINCDKAYRIRLALLNPEYIVYMLNSPYFSEELEKTKSGINDSGLNLKQDIFTKIPIPICSLAEQEQIVSEIDSRLSVCDKVEETIKTSLQQAESLRQSILKKAFEGNLLTVEELEQCRKETDWEPAEVLLKRIQEEKALAAWKPKGRK